MILPELKETLKEHIKKGDTICVFSDIANLGLPPSAKPIIKEKGAAVLLELYINTLQELVGEEGLLILPTFTYSATKSEIFDIDSSKSTVGVLTEYFQQLPEVKRSQHPIFSFAAWGAEKESFLKLESFDCFGPDSIFEKLYQRNATYILLGVDMQHGATYIYYSEQKMNVPYRYFKYFKGIIQGQNQQKEVETRYFVRNLEYQDFRYPLEKVALEEGVAKLIKFNAGNIIITKSQKIDQFIQKKLQIDPYFLTRRREN